MSKASGVWIGTEGGKKHHHQAIVLIHGTAGPVVPYGKSVGGLDDYTELTYRLVLLGSLEGGSTAAALPRDLANLGAHSRPKIR